MTPEQKAVIDNIFRTGLDKLDYEMMDMAIARGADALRKDSDGDTFLHLKIRFADTKLIDYLLKAGIAVDAKNSAGRTALHNYVTSSSINPATIDTLLKHGADPMTQDKQGKVALGDVKKKLDELSSGRDYDFYKSILVKMLKAVPTIDAPQEDATVHSKKLDAMITAARDVTQPAPQFKIPPGTADQKQTP